MLLLLLLSLLLLLLLLLLSLSLLLLLLSLSVLLSLSTHLKLTKNCNILQTKELKLYYNKRLYQHSIVSLTFANRTLHKTSQIHLILWCGKFEETHNFRKFQQNYRTRKFDEITIFYAVKVKQNKTIGKPRY